MEGLVERGRIEGMAGLDRKDARVWLDGRDG